MQRYLNRGGDSGVLSYEIGPDYIKVRFSTGTTYVYTSTSAGASHIENMKQLAQNGVGLNSYINTRVRTKYSSKY